MKALDRALQRWRINQARPHISRGARVLDVGCGDGALFRQLGSQIGSGVGIDPNLERAVESGNVRLVPGHFPRDLPQLAPFDVITLLAVLEHVPSAEQPAVAQACARSLNPRGRVVITVPSPLVDGILKVLRLARLIDGMALEQHYGFEPERTVALFEGTALKLICRRRFQLGLNNLFVFEKTAS